MGRWLEEGTEVFPVVSCCSVAKSCSTLCNPMNCSTPGFPVLHHLGEFAQTHVHWVGDIIQPSHPLSSSSPAFSLSPSGSFLMSQVFTSGSQNIGASASVLPMHTQGVFPLGWTGLISLQFKGSQESSPALQFESTNSLALSFVYSPTPTSIHDHWKNHSSDCIDLCRQSSKLEAAIFCCVPV